MKKLTLGRLGVNTYILTNKNDAYLIDPGFEGETIKENLAGYNLLGILLTHGHFDHIGKIGEFKCPIFIHKDDLIYLKDDNYSGFRQFNLKREFDFEKLDLKMIEHNDSIPFGKEEIKVIHTPGHTNGSVSYLYQDRLFSGDTLFRNDVGRTDLMGGDVKKLKKSIRHLLEKIPDYVKVYPGHEENTNIKHERMNNSFYRECKND